MGITLFKYNLSAFLQAFGVPLSTCRRSVQAIASRRISQGASPVTSMVSTLGV